MREKCGLTQLQEEKKKLVQQRADLVSADLFDLHSKEVFDERINEVTEMIDDLRYQKKHASKDHDSRVITFCKFLELRENLVLYWKSADFSKKAIFSKISLLNLTVS